MLFLWEGEREGKRQKREGKNERNVSPEAEFSIAYFKSG